MESLQLGHTVVRARAVATDVRIALWVWGRWGLRGGCLGGGGGWGGESIVFVAGAGNGRWQIVFAWIACLVFCFVFGLWGENAGW